MNRFVATARNGCIQNRTLYCPTPMMEHSLVNVISASAKALSHDLGVRNAEPNEQMDAKNKKYARHTAGLQILLHDNGAKPLKLIHASRQDLSPAVWAQ